MTEQMFMDRGEAAKTAGVSPDTITRAINAGKLRAKRTGTNAQGDPAGKYLISREALQDWFEGLASA